MNEHLYNPSYFSTSQRVLPQLSVSYLVSRGCFWEENPVSPSSLCSALTPTCFYTPAPLNQRLSACLSQPPHCLLKEQNQALFKCARDADDSSGYSSLMMRRFLWFRTYYRELDDCEAKSWKVWNRDGWAGLGSMLDICKAKNKEFYVSCAHRNTLPIFSLKI